MSESTRTLNAAFNKNIRPFMDVIDNLRQYGLSQDLNLPTVVVIGDQSSGKSSILEAISGIQLPRGTGMVTRCPLQLRMSQTKNSKWFARLDYNVPESVKSISVDINDPSKVDKAIREAQTAIIGSDIGVSDTLLSLHVQGPDVPDLTLIDLPGIARVSVGDQSNDLPEKIMEIILKYISCKETLILTVCPCTTDLATTEALKLAQKYDTDLQRTYGVLTKADLVDEGSEENLLKILNNEVIPLAKGYTIVKCRSQKDLKNQISLKKSLAQEKSFFENHQVFRNLHKSFWGIENLSNKLARDLLAFIKMELPNIRATILSKQRSLTDEKTKLVLDYPTTNDTQLIFAMKKTETFLALFIELAEGKHSSEELSKVEDNLKKMTKKINLRLIPYARKIFENLRSQMLQCTPGSSLDMKIKEILYKGQGKEPREFLSFDTFRNIAREFLQAIEGHVFSCLDQIYSNLEFVLTFLVNYYFQKYSNFKANYLICVMECLKEAKEKCTKDLELMLNKEKVFFTIDKMYEEKIDSLHALQNIKYAMRSDWLSYFAQPKQNGPITLTIEKDLPKYIVVYYLLAINRIVDNTAQSLLYLLQTDFYSSLRDKLHHFITQPKFYSLLQESTSGITEKKNILDLKLKGLEKGIKEIDKLLAIDFVQTEVEEKIGDEEEEEEEEEEEDEEEEEKDEE